MEESWLSRLQNERRVTTLQPLRWPPRWLPSWAESLCAVLDRIPSVAREDGQWGWYRNGAWGCRLRLWRIWSEAPVIDWR